MIVHPHPPQGRTWLCSALALAATLCFAACQGDRTVPVIAAAQGPVGERVLVVYNATLKDSPAVAKDYATLRNVPEEHLCPISPPSDTALSIGDFEETVKKPVRECLQKAGSHEILYIVLSYRTPFRVIEPDGKVNLAIDSVLSDVWNEILPQPFPERNLSPHPYFSLDNSKARQYTDHLPLLDFRERESAPRLYSVFRLDAPTEILAAGLVRKALTAERAGGAKGRGCFDRNSGALGDAEDRGYAAGEWDIERAAELARQAGWEVTLDDHKEEFGSAPAPARCEDAVFYAGWYSLNNYNDAFTWATGAIGLHLDSLSALHPRSGKNWASNAIASGITATSGAIDEPYLAAMPHPDGVLRDLMQGANLGDAMLRNTMSVKWRIIHIGDPLYRPFPRGLGAWAASASASGGTDRMKQE
ncbi:MAG: TIGR03790 family protein [Bryobacterales bacterium]|nr:TIGR03790 family protein [Bryobacterales bacterium]